MCTQYPSCTDYFRLFVEQGRASKPFLWFTQVWLGRANQECTRSNSSINIIVLTTVCLQEVGVGSANVFVVLGKSILVPGAVVRAITQATTRTEGGQPCVKNGTYG